MFTLRTLVQLSLSSSLGLGLLLLFSLIYSSALHEELVVHRSILRVPSMYIQTGKPNPDQKIRLIIGLASPNMSRLEKRLYEISDSNHIDYGKYLTRQETETFVRPDANVTTAVFSWLSRNNVRPQSATSPGHRLYMEMSVTEAEQTFNTTFNSYNHILTNTTVIRATQYSVPGSLVDDITFVHPVLHFPSNPTGSHLRRTGSRRFSSSNPTEITRRDGPCADPQGVTVNCVMDLYHIPTDTGVPRTDDDVLVLSFKNQTLQGLDFAIFMKEFRPDIPLSDVQLGILSVNGGDNPQGPGVSQDDALEADLDVQMVAGISPKSRMTVVTTFLSDGTDFLVAFDSLLSQDSMTTVISMSYGLDEVTDADAVGDFEFMNSLCDDIMQLTARGITVVVSSGDGGVAGQEFTSDCTTFRANFPSSCPFALSVGATQLSSGNVETAASLSGGGFSNLFSMPPYQTATVGKYLSQLGSVYSGLYNSTGRGFPDISAIGISMLLVDSELGTVDGTSVSAPLVAGTLAAINDVRRANGKSPMGFIHPWIYANPDAVTDITQGSNPGCNTNGFPAMEGWDPVTGMGTPLFDKLLAMP